MSRKYNVNYGLTNDIALNIHGKTFNIQYCSQDWYAKFYSHYVELIVHYIHQCSGIKYTERGTYRINPNILLLTVILTNTVRRFLRYIVISACKGVIRLIDNEGTIESPGFSANQPYPTQLTCKWFIIGPTGSTVSITFESFALEETKKCDYDYVTIEEMCTGEARPSGNLRGRPDRYCGSRMPPAINSTCNELRVTFISDDSKTDRGFRAKYKIHRETGKIPACVDPAAS